MSIRRNHHSTPAWQRWLVFFGVCLAVAACGGDSTTIAEPGPTVLVPPNGSAEDPISGSDSGPTIFFPKQKPVEGERVVMTAELFGELAVLGGCLRVASFSGSNTGYLLVWPPDFRLSTESDGIQVLDGDGEVAVRLGEEVFMSGGEVRYVHRLEEYVQRQLHPDCTGPYWIVGGVVSSAKSLQVFGPKIYYHLQPPTVGDRVNMLAGGNIELVLDEGCLRMGSADGDLIIWPPGFSLTTEDNGVQILNKAGEIVARVGEKVRMGGGQISYPSQLGEYVLRHLPPSCPGPYWVVGSVPTGPPQDDPYKLSSE
jgi:hypothetical protein